MRYTRDKVQILWSCQLVVMNIDFNIHDNIIDNLVGFLAVVKQFADHFCCQPGQ